MEELFSKFKGLRIAVIGDIILDKYVFGRVERISPEAPVPVFEIEREEFRAGGVANVAVNLKVLGVGKVALLGRVGKDLEGKILKELTDRFGVENLAVEGDIPTTRKTRLIARSQQLIRIDRESRKPLSRGEVEEILERLSDFRPDAVVVSDYAKGVFTEALSRSLKKFNIPVFVDPRPANAELYGGFTCITPNLKEFLQISEKLQLGGNFEEKAKELKRLLNLDKLVVTLGEKGIALVDKGIQYFPATAKEVYDVTGAGDTVIATLSAVVTAGGDWKTACRLANLAAGIVVGKLGTAYATREEILESSNKGFEGQS